MANEIHVIFDEDGTPLYREWSTISNSYVSEPTYDLSFFKKTLLTKYLSRAEEEFEREFNFRIARAESSGTSRIYSKRSLTKWEDEE